MMRVKIFTFLVCSLFASWISAFAQTCPSIATTVIETCNDAGGNGVIRIFFMDGDAPSSYILYTVPDFQIANQPLGPVAVNSSIPLPPGAVAGVEFTNVPNGDYTVRANLPGHTCPPLNTPYILVGALGININSANALSISNIITDPDCNPATGGGNADGGITLTIRGGVAPYNVSWSTTATSIPPNVVNSNPGNLSISNLDGGTYTITAVDANNCVSSQVIHVPISTQPNAGADQTLCNETTTSLQGNAPGPGEIGTWSVISGTGILSNPNDPNSSVSGLTAGTTTTFRWTIRDAGGLCPGNPDDVTITTDAAPTTATAGPDQVLCNTTTNLAANTPTVGSGNWSIISGSGGTVADSSNPTSAFTGLAGQTYQLQWTVTNASCPPSSDNVQITFDATPTAALAGDDQVVCATSTALAGNAPVSGNGTWTIVSGTGGTIANVSNPNSTFTGSAGATYVLRWTIANGSCPPSSDDVQISFDQAPTIANAGPNRNVCGTSRVLEGNAPVIGTGRWTVVSGVGGSFADDTQHNTTFTGTQGTTYVLRWTISNGSCPARTDDVQIRFDAPPTPANAGPDQVICGTSTTLAANTPVIGTGAWAIVSGAGGSVASPANPSSGFTGTPGVTYTLRWRTSNGVCAASNDNVVITLQSPPTTANAGLDQTVCATTTSLAANTPVTGTGIWTIVSGTGGSIATPSSPASSFAGTQGSTYVLRWTISNGSCPPSFDEVQITFEQTPTIANAGPDQVLCNTTTTLAANVPTVGSGVWSITAGSGGNLADPSNPASAFSGNAGATYTLRWTIDNGTCSESTDDVIVTFELPPSISSAGPDQSVCGTSATLAANAPSAGSGVWSIENGAGGVITNPNNPASQFNGVAGTTYTLRWTIANGTCPSSTDEVTITLEQAPTVANAGPDVALCATNTTLAANAPAVGTGIWSIVSGSGGNLGNASNPSTSFSGNAGQTYMLRWTITNGSCPSSSDEVQVTFESLPTTANAGPDQTICSPSATLAANVPVIGSGTWSIENGTGGSIADPSNPVSSFTGVPGTSYTLRWSVTNGSCAVSVDDVIITLEEAPTVASAGPDQTICSTTTTLAGNAPTTGAGLWTVVSGSGGLLSDASSPISSFSGNAGETYVLRWTISSGSCTPNADEVTIIFESAPTNASAGPDQSLCGTSSNLAANAPSSGTGIWTIESGTGGSFADTASPTSTFSGSIGSTYTLRWTIANGSCAASFDEVQITFLESPTVANAGQDRSVCATSTLLTANTPAVGTGMWSIVSGTGGSVVTPSDPASQFTGVAGQTYELRWTISNGLCPASSDNVLITFEAAPTAAVAGPDQSICASTTTLAANNPATGTGVWTIISGTGGSIANPADRQSDFSGVAGQTYVLRWTVSSSCGTTSDDVQISFDEGATVAVAGPDKTICGSAALEGNAPSVGSGSWSIVSGSGGIFLDVNDPTTLFSGEAGAVYILRWTISSGSCAPSFDDVEISIDSNSPTPANAGPDQQVCGNVADLAANVALVGTGSWSVVTGAGGSFADISNPASEFWGVPGTTYTLHWTITSPVVGCDPTMDAVVIAMEDSPTIAAAGNDQILCAATTTLQGNTPASGAGIWAVVSGTGGSFSNPNDPTSTFTGTPGVTYVLEWGIANSCGMSSDEVSITLLSATVVANAGADKTVCGATTLDGNSPATGTGVWTIVSGTGGIIAEPNNPVSAFVGNPGQVYVLRWAVTVGSCAPSFDEVQITIDPNTPTPATAGADQSICGMTATLNANTPANGTGMWTIVSGNGGTLADPTLNNSAFSGIIGETYVLRWEITTACGSDSDEVSIVFNQPGTVADAGADQTICGPATLAANEAIVGSGTWTIESGTGGILSNVNDPQASFTGVAGTVYTLRWTITNGGCTPSSDDVVVTIDSNSPTPANAGTDQNICDVTTVLAANAPLIGTGSWSIISGLGGNIDDPANHVSSFNGVAGAQYVLRWTISSGAGCADTFDDVTITFEQSPTLPDAGSDQQVCGANVVLAANAPVSGTGSWSVASGNGGSFADATDPATTFTGIPGNTYVLAWTISSTCGNAADQVQLVLDEAPTAAVAGADRSVCGPATLEGNTPSSGTGLWTIESGVGGILSDPANPTSGFNGVAGSTYTLRWTISNGTCAASSDEVEITFDLDTPTPADAGSDQALCGTTTALAGNIPLIGTGEWTIISGTGGSIADPADPTSAFDGDPGSTYTLRWTISSTASCAPSSDDVIVAFETTPDPAVAGPDQIVCGTMATLAATPVTNGTGTWSIITGTGGSFADVNDPTSQFTGNAGEVYTIRWTVQNACAATSDELTIRLDGAPTVADAGIDQVICSGINVTLAASAPTSGVGLWTIISGTGGAVVSPNSATSQFVGTLGNSYTLRWIVANGTCTPSTDDVVINFAASPSVTSPVTVCVNNAAPVLNASALGATGFNWYYYTDSTDPSTRTLLASTVTGSYTPGAELNMAAVNTVAFEVTAVYACGESPVSNIVVNVSNTGGCGVVGGNCATVVITPVPTPATCTLSTGGIFFNINPATPVVNNVGVIIEIQGISITNQTISRTTHNDPNFTNLPIGEYRYSIVYGEASCVKTGFVTIDQSGTVGTPVATNIVNPTCAGSATGAVTIDVAGETGNLLEWSLDGITWTSFVSGTQITGIPAGPAPTFDRLISVRRNSSDPCNAAVMVQMQDSNSAITWNLMTTTSVSACGSSDGSISVPGITGGSGEKHVRLYMVTSTGPQLIENYASATNPFVFTGLESGTYFIEVRDAIGCIADSQADPVIINAPGAVQYSVSILGNADCGVNAGKNGVVAIRFDPAESTGRYQIGVSTSPVVEPHRYILYNYNQGVVEDIVVDTLSRGNFFVWVKPDNDQVCPSVQSTGFIDGPYPVSFNVQRICGQSNGSVAINLVNVQGDPAVPFYNVEVYRVADLSDRVDNFSAERVNDIISIAYEPGNPEHSWLASPEQYVIRVYQLNQLYCQGERPPRTPFQERTYTVSTELAHVVDKIKASFPEPRTTGGFLLKTISGGLPLTDESGTYYLVSLIDPGTSSEIVGPLKVRRSTQGNYQYEFRNLPIGNYIVRVTDGYGCTSTSTVVVPADTRLIIPNIFTPNGDGVNDVFEIVNLPIEGAHRLLITNRWGKEVFSSGSYKEGTFWTGEGMPEGIYFYRLDVQGDQSYNGWVEITRGSKP